jgi:PHP family Zn ribbon phosphoesterase
MTENERAVEDVNGGKIVIEDGFLPGWYTCYTCRTQKKQMIGFELLTKCPDCGGDLIFHTNEKLTHYSE